MEKKLYIVPAIKAAEMDEELLASMSGGGDVTIPSDESGEGDGGDAAAKGVWGDDIPSNSSVWDE